MIGALELGFQWRQPQMAAAMLLVALALWVRHRQRAAVASSVAGRRGLPRTWRTRLLGLPWWCEGLALLALVAALMRPIVVENEPPMRRGRDVLLCLDRSSSMAAEDLESGRSRLEVGRTLAAEFLAGRRDDRVGIVTFARFADLLCPPTVDHAAAVELLRRVRLVDPEGPEDATAIGAAVGLAASLLQRSRAAGKVVVVLTDGEENVATGQDPEQIAPLHAGQWCREQGVRVHAIVLGKGERMADGRWRALDTTAMRQLAKVSGGNFFAAADAAALRSVYREIDRLEAVQFGEPGVRVTEWYAVPAAAFLVLLFVGHLWSRSAWGGIP